MSYSKLTQTIDATVWAKEFIDLFGHCPEQITYDLMVAWFANAIMTGYDAANKVDLTQQTAIAHSMISTDGEVFTKRE